MAAYRPCPECGMDHVDLLNEMIVHQELRRRRDADRIAAEREAVAFVKAIDVAISLGVEGDVTEFIVPSLDDFEF